MAEMLEPHIRQALADARRERAQKLEDRRIADLKEVLKTPQGRRTFFNILDDSRFMAASYVPGDARASDFNEGKRDLGLGLMRDLMKAAPQVFTQMLGEKASEEKQYEQQDEILRKKLTEEV